MATYKIVSHGGNGLPLNVETTSTISGRTNVNIWKKPQQNPRNGDKNKKYYYKIYQTIRWRYTLLLSEHSFPERIA